jgi:hypothetical protein
MSKRPINFMTTSPPSKVQHIVPITPHSNDKAQFNWPYQYRSQCDYDNNNDDNSDEDNTIDSNDDDDDNDNYDDDEEDNNNSNNIHHHIIQTILGPVCTKCYTKIVLRDNLLFTASRNTIRKHLTTNKCYQGNISNITYFNHRTVRINETQPDHCKNPCSCCIPLTDNHASHQVSILSQVRSLWIELCRQAAYLICFIQVHSK